MQYPAIKKPSEIPYLFGEAWNNYDADSIAALFIDNADFINVTGKWWDKKSEIRKAHDFGFQMIFSNSHLEVLKVKEKLLSDYIAVVHARIRVTGQTKNQVANTGNRDTMFIFVAKKTKDEWLVVSAQNTDIIYGMQTNIRDAATGDLKSVKYKKEGETITYDLNEHQDEA